MLVCIKSRVVFSVLKVNLGRGLVASDHLIVQVYVIGYIIMVVLSGAVKISSAYRARFQAILQGARIFFCEYFVGGSQDLAPGKKGKKWGKPRMELRLPLAYRKNWNN